MGLSHSPRIVTDGLVLCLDAANVRSYPKSGTTWSDLMANYSGAFVNMDASNFDESNAGALDFDGTDEYVSLGIVDGIFTQDATISTWVYTRANNGRIISQNWNFTGNEYGWAVHLGTSNWTAVINSPSITWMSADQASNYNPNACVQSDTNSISLNEWFNITIVKSGSNVTIYKNAISIKTGTVPSSITYPSTNSAKTLAIGTNQFDGDTQYFNSKFNGKIGLLNAYNRALTGDEVRQNYEATVGRYT